jgi:tRNA threonylcarbamoyl adenosine modification protein YeaZ
VLLAWDTATDVVTVAVHGEGQVLAHRTGTGTRRHAEVLTPLICDALGAVGARGHDLTEIVAGSGPGAYTGLRVGLVTAQALSLAWGIPAYGVCSLDALAVQAVREHPRRYPDGVLVVTDARRNQVFWARYDGSGSRRAGPSVSAPESVPGGDGPCVGSGALAHREIFPRALEPSRSDAGWLAAGVAAGVIARGPLLPLYLRQPDVTLPAGAKPVLQRTAARTEPR